MIPPLVGQRCTTAARKPIIGRRCRLDNGNKKSEKERGKRVKNYEDSISHWPKVHYGSAEPHHRQQMPPEKGGVSKIEENTKC